MDCKINWTHRAWKTYKANIDYLLQYWTEKEISRFVIDVDNKLENIAKHPSLGSSRSKNIPISVTH